ncbi:inositol monophosphatase family protein [Arthrobacter sp. MMS18-M83]|uniref:inositol monophosphatase family protein n=1 Tax=Arthrobacter sp. MMS18-M83 TaxID=2996261 RepID=UPI00227A36F5|nr:inositol monophosphatase family protein [Arthrobacter sp. MMS18-M83]WAH99102.1 glycerophosphodiester phosphodiesterase family protein [Arthrobacter sp. MMS18-M83]
MSNIIGTKKTRATAHRGDSSNFLENTLPAIASAIEAGADLVEVDVRVTKDGQVILLHDASLLRIWGLDCEAADVDYDRISQLGAGEERIPLLSEALELFRGSPSTLLIDMDEPGPAETAAAVVRESGVAVSWCGNLDGMRTIRALDQDARIWLPWNKRVAPPEDLLAELNPEFVNSEYVVLSKDMVEQIHLAGAKVSCWTVDDLESMRWALGLGVDSITSNQLDLLQSAIAEDPEAWASAEAPRALAGDEVLESRKVALELAEWAVGYMRDADRGQVSTKAHPADLVTEVDVAVERYVREVIAARLPGHTVVGEEMGGVAVPGAPCWYLDPVDGTTNYVNHIPWTAFSLALAMDRKPAVAVVADPWRGEIFEAVAGWGARLDRQPLLLAPAGVLPAPLAGTVVATELAGHLPWPGMLKLLEELGERHSIMRIMGSATMTVVGVAAGRGAGAIIGGFSPIDHLAATLIVHEAGGVVLNSDGETDMFPEHGGVLVVRPEYSAELYELWRQVSADAGN